MQKINIQGCLSYNTAINPQLHCLGTTSHRTSTKEVDPARLVRQLGVAEGSLLPGRCLLDGCGGSIGLCLLLLAHQLQASKMSRQEGECERVRRNTKDDQLPYLSGESDPLLVLLVRA